MIKENESKPLSHNEVLKEADPILAGELASTLLNKPTAFQRRGQFLQIPASTSRTTGIWENGKSSVHDPRAHRQRYSRRINTECMMIWLQYANNTLR